MKIPIEVSARHVHLNDEAVRILFGSNKTLTFERELSQPGNFVCKERVNVIGPKHEFKNVAIIGPTRAFVQVELSLTDFKKIGIKPVIRESGDLKGSSSCKIVGPEGEIEIKEGIIASKRHLHLNSKEAEKRNIKSGANVWIRTINSKRNLIFGDVVVRVSQKFSTALHIDVDEANAAGIEGEAFGEIVN